MKVRFVYYLLFVLVTISIVSCKTSTSAYSKCETTCISSDLDGSYTLRVEGRGSSEADAFRDAQKRAVYDILFTSIPRRDGVAKTLEPICIYKQKAYADNEEYFNVFFKANGEFEKYVDTWNLMANSKVYKRSNSQVVCVTTVSVNRYKLREKLIADGIIGK